MPGITLRSREIMILEHTSTKVKAAPMPRALETAVVTARMEQVPEPDAERGFL